MLATACTTAVNKFAAAAAAVSKLSTAQLAEGVQDLQESPEDAPDALLSLQAGATLTFDHSHRRQRLLSTRGACLSCALQAAPTACPCLNQAGNPTRCKGCCALISVSVCVCVSLSAVGANRVNVLVSAGSGGLVKDSQLGKTCQVREDTGGCWWLWLDCARVHCTANHL